VVAGVSPIVNADDRVAVADAVAKARKEDKKADEAFLESPPLVYNN
jgi:hypothetical protein